MRAHRPSLRHVPSTVLGELRSAILSNRLPTPIDRAALVGLGIRHDLRQIEEVLAGQTKEACLLILEVALEERGERSLPPELVWTGPEGFGSTARDTAIVLRSLFENAQRSVILAGYSFDHAAEVLAALHRSMKKHEQLQVLFFVDVPQIEKNVTVDWHIERHLKQFRATNWPFGAPHPRVYFDKRALTPGPPHHSLHAKCVVVDLEKAFVSSANFTQRGQERNIEVGVYLEDQAFARSLGGQWFGLIEAGLVQEYAVE